MHHPHSVVRGSYYQAQASTIDDSFEGANGQSRPAMNA